MRGIKLRFALSMHAGMQASTVQGSMMGASRMDHSFVVLPKQKHQGHGVPPRPRSTTPQPDNSHSAKAIEESYVVLPPAAASMYKSELTPEEGGAQQRFQGGSPSSGLQVNGPGFHSSIILKRAFDIATTQTQVLALQFSNTSFFKYFVYCF